MVSATMRAAMRDAERRDAKDSALLLTPEAVAVRAFRAIIDRSRNGELGTSKVIDMRTIAENALTEMGYSP